MEGKGRKMGKIIRHHHHAFRSCVLSKDPKQRRKIMSPWVGIMMMGTGSSADTSNFLQQQFSFCHSDYDLILFPIIKKNEGNIDGDGHWFTIAINMVDKKFQVIDSLRAPTDKELVNHARKVCGKIVTLWRTHTENQLIGCTIPQIYNFKTEFVNEPRFKQFSTHDCGLFTLKAIEHWDGVKLPQIRGNDEINSRRRMLCEWIRSPGNEVDGMNILINATMQKHTKGKVKMGPRR
ncbi:hypothetical protein BS78_K311300 [Paspalum vaginatum]|uniref:Ubiquitin-like protease family profile domain-containing protein n=1 Tax=Paspalum vaginatum TaxID=158149 RepID=A0A9W8CFD8_9POAL|nr:hypothetical protein BS78_K311300 [Paspalum vaginatum]